MNQVVKKRINSRPCGTKVLKNNMKFLKTWRYGNLRSLGLSRPLALLRCQQIFVGHSRIAADRDINGCGRQLVDTSACCLGRLVWMFFEISMLGLFYANTIFD